MRIDDPAQNLSGRVRIIQSLVLASLFVLLVRLYDLQIVRGTHYAELARNERLRVLPIPAPRGAIFDRQGRLLVDSRPIYKVVLSRQDLGASSLNAVVDSQRNALQLDADYIRDQLAKVTEQPAYQTITIKDNATSGDIAWVEAHSIEYPALHIEQYPQRRYPRNGLLAHVLGYVGEISARQLKMHQYREKGYKSGDIIGKAGLEAAYDEYLRGRDGERTVLVDSFGRMRDTIRTVPPQPGQDLVTTIDLDLQLAAEQQLKNSPSQRGVIIVMDPNNGELLALASAPTFDPNLFTEQLGTSAGRAEYAKLLGDPHTPLYNRAIQGRYPPGSTWKVPMAVAALQQGVITLDNSRLSCGGGIWVGNKFTRCMGHHGRPDLHTAIMKSCDGYFYRLGLRMGLPGIMKMVDEFQLNKRTGIDLPNELVSWTPSPQFKARFNPRAPDWSDIDTVYASFGQVYDFVTPMALLRAFAAVGNGGTLYTPHLMKQIRSVGQSGNAGYRPIKKYSQKPVIIPIPREQDKAIVQAMWSVVNEAGTAARIRKAGFDIAGKTGTAQVVGLGKDIGRNKDHSWFVSYAPAFHPEISVLALIENSGFGSQYAAPAVRAIYDAYYDKLPEARTLQQQIASR